MIADCISATISLSLLSLSFALPQGPITPVQGECLKSGCHAQQNPIAACATLHADIILVAGTGASAQHGACSCPESGCRVSNNSCSMNGFTISITIKAPSQPTHDVIVSGVNMGDSWVWNPGAASGCGDMKWSIQSIVGPGFNCTFVLSIGCEDCFKSC